MKKRTLLTLKRTPTLVTSDYDITGKKAGELYGTGVWRLKFQTAKSHQEERKLLIGLHFSWNPYRECLTKQGWRSIKISIGGPRRVRLIWFIWTDQREN